MKKYRKIIFINFIVIISLLFFIEFCCRFFVSDILLTGTSSNIFLDNRFNYTPGFLPNSEGKSFDKKITIDSKGSIKSTCSGINNGKKILFLGDSVTQGVGVDADSSFTAKLTCQYKDSETITNLALIGYRVSDYKNVIEVLLKEGQLDFQKIVMNFCLNDIYDSRKKDTGKGDFSLLKKIKEILKSNSYFYLWLKNQLLDRSKSYYMFDSQLYKDSTELKRLEKSFIEIKDLCEKKGIHLCVVIYPYEYQIRQKSNELFFPQDSIVQLLENNNITSFRLENFLNEISLEEGSKELYLYGDGIHFSNSGHRKIYEYFLSEKILE